MTLPEKTRFSVRGAYLTEHPSGNQNVLHPAHAKWGSGIEMQDRGFGFGTGPNSLENSEFPGVLLARVAEIERKLLSLPFNAAWSPLVPLIGM
jgi:hypothetical protein